MPQPPATIWFYLAWVGCRAVFRAGLRWQVSGVENVPCSGPVLLMPNHVSYLDPPLVGAAVPRVTYYMAKVELFQNLAGAWLLPRLNAFPVRRGYPDRPALRRTLELLERGQAVIMFPEGTRSPDGSLQPAEPGAALIALKSRAPIVPVAIVGTEHIWPRWTKWPRLGRVRIRYGRPLTFPDYYDRRVNKNDLRRVGDLIMNRIAALLAEERQQANTAA